MKKNLPLENFTYKGENYKFAFVNPNEAFQRSLIVRPKHLKLLSNDTDMDPKQLIELIVEEWFQEENEKLNSRKKPNVKQKNINTVYYKTVAI